MQAEVNSLCLLPLVVTIGVCLSLTRTALGHYVHHLDVSCDLPEARGHQGLGGVSLRFTWIQLILVTAVSAVQMKVCILVTYPDSQPCSLAVLVQWGW